MANRYRLKSTNPMELSTGWNREGKMDFMLKENWLYEDIDNEVPFNEYISVIGPRHDRWTLCTADLVLIEESAEEVEKTTPVPAPIPYYRLKKDHEYTTFFTESMDYILKDTWLFHDTHSQMENEYPFIELTDDSNFIIMKNDLELAHDITIYQYAFRYDDHEFLEDSTNTIGWRKYVASKPIFSFTEPLDLSNHYVNITKDIRVPSCDIVPLEEKVTIQPLKWGPTQERAFDFIEDYVKEQIRTRYIFTPIPRETRRNTVIDSCMPRLFYNSNLNYEYMQFIPFPRNFMTISPWFADTLGIQQMKTDQMCRMLGYSARDLKDLVIAVKSQKYSVSFIGYGGTNVNTIHWLTEICEIVKVHKLFINMSVYEPDTLEISNLFRFPKNINTVASASNASKLALLSQKETRTLSNTNSQHVSHYYPDPVLGSKHILYGAPSIDIRNELSQHGNFIAATHGGDRCSLWLNPEQDSELQVEAYGLINLSTFFMNQLKLAIGFLETLANADFDPKEKDKCLLDYGFDGEAKLRCDRKYHFPMEHSGLIATGEEPND